MSIEWQLETPIPAEIVQLYTTFLAASGAAAHDALQGLLEVVSRIRVS